MFRNGSNEIGQTLTFSDKFFVTDLSLVGKANGVSIDPCGKGYYFHASLNPPIQKSSEPSLVRPPPCLENIFFYYENSISPFHLDTPILPFINAARIEKSQIFAHRESST